MSSEFEPVYLKLHRSGELKRRAEYLWSLMEKCWLCPRKCLKNRNKGEKGTCNATSHLKISSYNPHYGEEIPLVGTSGSGTIFFTNCGLRCVFCINCEISIEGQGMNYSIDNLVSMMLKLQDMGCHNINVVSPTHYSPHILKGLDIAAASGLRLPLVYNTCGWERKEILEKLDGVVDIYLADFKYYDSKMSNKYSSKAITYPEITKTALIEMNRQTGVAKPDKHGIMQRGLMIRHLVMPNNVSGTMDVIDWIAKNLPKDTYVNLMAQFRPYYKSNQYPEIVRSITREEYECSVAYARKKGLSNLDIQGY